MFTAKIPVLTAGTGTLFLNHWKLYVPAGLTVAVRLLVMEGYIAAGLAVMFTTGKVATVKVAALEVSVPQGTPAVITLYWFPLNAGVRDATVSVLLLAPDTFVHVLPLFTLTCYW